MAKLIEMITPTWIADKDDEYMPIYDPSKDGERIRLVRCKDCKKLPICCIRRDNNPEWFCAEGELKD